MDERKEEYEKVFGERRYFEETRARIAKERLKR